MGTRWLHVPTPRWNRRTRGTRGIHAVTVAGLVLLCVGACAEDPVSVTPNLAPTAYAGSDRTQLDMDGDGVAQVTLDGSRSHDPDGTIAAYAWLDRGDTIARVVAPEVSLALGVHEITLVVKDDGGATASDVALIAVRAFTPNRAPSVTIISPADGSEFAVDEGIVFRGWASDLDQGQLAGGRLRWMCDGRHVGSGAEVVISDLDAGVHTCSLSVTDDENATTTVSITVRVHVSFAGNVLPFFLNYCVECHGQETSAGGVRLDSYPAITGSAKSGPLVLGGDPMQGILVPKLQSDHHRVILCWWECSDFTTPFLESILIPWILDGLPDN